MRVLFLILLIAIQLSAAPVGSVKGYVKDSSGAVVARVTVELKNSVTNVTQTTESDETGYFQFLQTPPGRYELTVKSPGFRTSTLREIQVLVDAVVSLDVILEVGAVNEVV